MRRSNHALVCHLPPKRIHEVNWHTAVDWHTRRKLLWRRGGGAARGPLRLTRAHAAGGAGWAAAVDDWHAAARRGLAALHFRQLALAPLAAHQAGPARRMWSQGRGNAAACGAPKCFTCFRRLPA